MTLPPHVEQFQRELRLRWPDFLEIRWNDAVRRWEFVFRSTIGKPVSEFLGWSTNPLTGEAIEPDPLSGLLPFRDLDAAAMASVIETGEKTYIGNRVDGAKSWKQYMADRAEHNRQLRKKRARQRGEDFAYLIQQVDIRRPGWKKDHVRQPKGQGPLFASSALAPSPQNPR